MNTHPIHQRAADESLGSPIKLVGTLAQHMSRDALVELEAALYDASSEEFSFMQAAADRAYRNYHRARWHTLKDAASYCSQQVQARGGAWNP